MRNKGATTKAIRALLSHVAFNRRMLLIALGVLLTAALIFPALWPVWATGKNSPRRKLDGGKESSPTSPASPAQAADNDHDGIDDALEQSLAETYAPVIYMEPGEPNYPVSVDWFLHHAKLRHDEDCAPDEDEDVPNAPYPIETQTELIGAPWVHPDSWGAGHPVAHCDEGNHQHGRISTIAPDPDGEGFTGYSDQTTFYLDDLPDEFHVGSLDPREWVTYFHAYPTAEGGVMIQYWHVYAYNRFGDGFDNHGGDWDASIQVQLFSNHALKGIWFSRHNDDHPGTFMPYDPAQPNLSFYQSTHPVMTIDGGGHAAFASASDWCADTHESVGARTGTIMWSDDPVSLDDPGQLREVQFDAQHPCTLAAPVGGTIWQTWTSGIVSQAGSSISHHVSPNPSTHGGLINLGEYNPCNDEGNCQGARQASGLLAGQFLPLNNQIFLKYSGRWGHTSLIASDGPRNPVFQGFHDGVYTSWYNQGPTPAPTPNLQGKISFQSDRDGPPQIYVMNADGTKQINLTNTQSGAFAPAAFTRDGSLIAFSSNRDGNGEIYVMNLDGTNQIRITNNPASDQGPAWSPDGGKIAFGSTRNFNQQDIYTMNADGTGVTWLRTYQIGTFGNRDPSWSPDGGKIAFSGGDGEIYSMNADGTNRTQLTFGTATDFGPEWSPDGRRILFSSSRDGNFQIYVMNSDGSNQTRLTNNTAYPDSNPTWSPDGSKISFTRNNNGSIEVFAMNADGTDQIDLAHGSVPTWAAGLVESFSIDDVTQAEGSSGLITYTFTVIRSGSTQNNATVNFATADGTATVANNDYQPASGTLTFLSGEWSKQITVLVNGDTNAEPNETFFLNLSGASNASIYRGQGNATILDDDTPNTPIGTNVKVQAADASVNFATVSQAGTTTFTSIAPASAGTLPDGYTLCSTCPAFDITTTAVYSPPVSVCLDVPANISQQVFSALKLMHGENGMLVDRTTNQFTDGNGLRWVCGNVQSLSPFALAQGTSPTAANAEVSGRVIDTNGNPVAGVVLRLSGTQSRETITGKSGNYQFRNVETGGFYTVTPARANFAFNPASRSFSLLGNRTEAAFTGIFGGNAENPIDTQEFFVRQQYVDFLDREPDQGGFEYWSGQLNQCLSVAGGLNPSDCMRARRIDVSAAFFVEQEFQQTGLFIYDLYVSALGRKPRFAEYSADRRQVVGGANLEAEKQSFTETFVRRAEFGEKYPASMTGEAFVDKLLECARQSSGVDLSGARDSLIARYNAGAGMIQSRTFVLREVADNPGFKLAEYEPAFVLMEYFGYLRRDPDQRGYDFWLNVLNHGESNSHRGMVCAFITSGEYQRRFSLVITHSNAECGP